MEQHYLKCNYIEILQLREKLKLKEKELENEIRLIKERLNVINKVIGTNDNGKQHWLVLLPAEIVSSTKNNSKEGKKRC